MKQIKMIVKKRQKLVLFVAISLTFVVISLKSMFSPKKEPAPDMETIDQEKINYFKSDTIIKDFFHYNCKDSKRIGGKPQYVSNTKNPQWRIDGAWFVCFDSNLKPLSDNCNILSFGINDDDSFDYDFNHNYGCNVYSFDPYVELERFSKLRNSNPTLKDSFKLKVNNKWHFYRTGLVGSVGNISNVTQIGGMNTLENIIEIIQLKEKVIDVLKIDIERGEVDVLENFNLDYACKYFKQFVLETHPVNDLDVYIYKLLLKLEKCFLLFRRDTRFFRGDSFGPTGNIIEYQRLNGWNLNIKNYKNEVILSKFLLSMGELYFINKNFI